MATETKLLYTVKPGFTTISPSRDVVVSFDREGRLFSFINRGMTYRRTLDSTVEARWREELPQRGFVRRRGRLTRDESRKIFAEAYKVAETVRPGTTGELQKRLDDEILPWTPERLLSEADRFAAVYKPISILPPDQYLSVVVQATEGCTWNRCTFCTFYQDRPFRVKSDDEFARHIAAVRRFFGRGLSMRKSVFVADGNALVLSQRRLLPMVERVRNTFPALPMYSFVDLYGGEQKSATEWKQLAELGLHRVYIGMETGLDELLSFMNKPGSQKELLHFVQRLKETGLAVGLIIMVGIGGAEYKAAHRKATLDALRQMPLDSDDLVYLSPFIEQPGSAYIDLRRSRNLTPLTECETEDEVSRLARKIRSFGVKAARYDIREFMY